MLWLCIRPAALRHEALAAEEGEALERLSAWAYQWSSQVCHRRSDENTAPLLWIELAASRALFGEPSALLTRIDRELAQMGYSHACAIAPSPAAAALLTRDRASRCLRTVAQLRVQLASLPLGWLELPVETLQALRSAGLSRIGEVLEIPRAALARRFGPQCSHYLAQLMGEASDPRPSFQLPQVYRARCVFDYDLHDTQGLLFPLQRLLQNSRAICARATGQCLASPSSSSTHADPPALPLSRTSSLACPRRCARRRVSLRCCASGCRAWCCPHRSAP